MAAQSQWYLVCYDIRDDKRLRKAAKMLEGYGRRIQYSIFRCWLSPVQLNQLRWELTRIVDPVDDVMFIPLCERCVEGLRVTHSSQKEPDWPEKPRNHEII